MVFIQLLLIFYQLTMVQVVEFRIDGQVDLGPNLNYKVKISQVTGGKLDLALRKGKKSVSRTLDDESESKNTSKIAADKIHAKLIVNDQSVNNLQSDNEYKTKINLSLNFDNFDGVKEKQRHLGLKFNEYSNEQVTNFGKNSVPMQRAGNGPQKIKDDENLQKYFNHLYNRALRALDALRENNKIKLDKSQLHKVKHMYMDKIHEYIVNMENQTLRTELGWQKAILNTLEVSNKIINKLLDRIDPPIKISQSLRNDVLPTYAIQKEFETDEYYFICVEHNICRTQRTFSDFLALILGMILKTDDYKVKQASDGLTEVIGDLNYQSIMDWESHKGFMAGIKKMESLDAHETRVMLTVLKNMIVHRNMPIKIFGNENMALVNKTVAFQTVLNEFDTALPGNKENMKKWDHIIRAVDRWTNGEKKSIQGVCEKLLKNVNDGIDYMSDNSIDIVIKNLHIVLA